MEKITMPKLGLTMTEGTVSRLKVAKGDSVKKGDVLLEVATDKLTYDVEAPGDGVVIDLLVSEGDTVPVGDLLVILGEEGDQAADAASGNVPKELPKKEIVEDAVKTPPAASAAEPAALSGTSASPLAKKWARAFGLDQVPLEGSGPGGMIVKADVMKEAEKLRATPLARKAAGDAGLDIMDIQGSGPGGMTVSSDVKARLEDSRSARVKASPMASRMAAELGVDLSEIRTEGRIMKNDVLEMAHGRAAEPGSAAPGPDASEAGEAGKRVPLSPMRKVIAQRMFMSTSTIPSVFFNIEADFGEFIRFRENLNSSLAEKGIKISFNDILMKICAAALMKSPLANSWYDSEKQEYIMHSDANIGLAVAVEGGLLVPNVKGVQRKSLVQVAKESAELVGKARKGKLLPDEMQGGTFTITNLGMFGIHDFIPIINPPEACILAVNAVIDRPVVRNGEIEVRPVSMIGLSADHRILNGAEAAEFLANVRKLVESPWLLTVPEAL